MKLSSLVLAPIASHVAVASAQPAPSNVSSPSMALPSNSAHEGAARKWACTPYGGITGWYYNSWSSGPYACYGKDTEAWTMRYAYRSGGVENVHWKYTDDPRDPACLGFWEWYEEDGVQIITEVQHSTIRDFTTGRLWCALPVYRSGGLKDRQWKWCAC
jgi:hypothetical protein